MDVIVEIGKFNKLRVVKEVEFGIYLDGGDYGEILLPKKYIPKDTKDDDILDVFIYFDSKDRIIATTEKPLSNVGEFTCLEVASITKIGAFLYWGLPKDLFVPFAEQRSKMKEGEFYVVYLYIDNSERICASSKIEKFLNKEPAIFKRGQAVNLLICNKTDLGYSAIIDGTHLGLLFNAEVFQPIKNAQYIEGAIKRIREDGKIDLCIHKPGFRKVDSLSEKILSKLEENNGFLNLTDKSPPEAIYKMFDVSKKTYKKSIGNLYKKKIITILKDGIKLNT